MMMLEEEEECVVVVVMEEEEDINTTTNYNTTPHVPTSHVLAALGQVSSAKRWMHS